MPDAEKGTTVAAVASDLLLTDALTPNHDGTPEHYLVDAENIEYLVGTVLALAAGHTDPSPAEPLRYADGCVGGPPEANPICAGHQRHPMTVETDAPERVEATLRRYGVAEADIGRCCDDLSPHLRPPGTPRGPRYTEARDFPPEKVAPWLMASRNSIVHALPTLYADTTVCGKSTANLVFIGAVGIGERTCHTCARVLPPAEDGCLCLFEDGAIVRTDDLCPLHSKRPGVRVLPPEQSPLTEQEQA